MVETVFAVVLGETLIFFGVPNNVWVVRVHAAVGSQPLRVHTSNPHSRFTKLI